jgi:hypothetical protein
VSQAGTLFTFTDARSLEEAVKRAISLGLTDFEPLTPYSVEAINALMPRDPSLPRKGNVVGMIALAAGITGMLSGFGLQWIANSWALPMNAGGRPFFSWPNYIPVTFVLSILFAGTAVFFSVFLLSNLPLPYHPLFDSVQYSLERDLFYLYVPRTADQRHSDCVENLRAFFPRATTEEVGA